MFESVTVNTIDLLGPSKVSRKVITSSNDNNVMMADLHYHIVYFSWPSVMIKPNSIKCFEINDGA